MTYFVSSTTKYGKPGTPRLPRTTAYGMTKDLVREVLAHATDALSRFPAVFCDEAQDFTSLELELIQKLSLYTNRDLPSYLARHVPFAFAGDPFQTLNPTGFNWDAVQASFHSNIVQRIDGLGEAKLNFNFKNSISTTGLPNIS